MCIEIKICCAPIAGGRCPNKTVHSNSDHCSDHHDDALESYLNYKRISKIVDSKDVYLEFKDTRQHFKYLYECHKLLVDAYCGRSEHAEKFYVIKTQDHKHDKAFEVIMTKINFCRAKMKELKEKLNIEIEPTKSKQKSPKPTLKRGWNVLEYFFPTVEDSSTVENLSIQTAESNNSNKENNMIEENAMLEDVVRFEQKQQADDREFNRQLRADQKKNKKLALEKRKIAVLSKNLISQELTYEFDNYFLQMCFINIMSQFNGMGYFEEDYIPEECGKCSCGGYVPVQFKLGCSCFLNKDGECVDFLCKSPMTRDNLAEMCHYILTEQHKIKPVIKELINYYKIHGTKLLHRLMTLTWNPELDRLVLSCEYIKNYQKPSANMAESRKRRQLGRSKTFKRGREMSPDTKWGHILDQLNDYVTRNGKLPPANSKNIFTSFLHRWLMEQLDDYANENSFLYDEQNREHFEKFIRKYPRFFSVFDE